MKKSLLLIWVLCSTAGFVFAGGNAEDVSVTELTEGAFPFTLGVYGNADMNDILDERDIEYVQGIIEGKEKKTKFADADNDGFIDEADIEHIKRIMTGGDCVLTVEDHTGRTVSIEFPVKRIVSGNTGCLRSLVALGVLDKTVGITSETVMRNENLTITKVYPEILSLPQVGKYRELSFESIVELKPDIIFYAPWITDKATVDGIQERTGAPVVCLGPLGNIFEESKGCYDSWRLAGIIVGETERAEELIQSFEAVLGEIKAVTSDLTDDEKPKAFYGGPVRGWVCTSYKPIDIAGGLNVGEGIVKGDEVEVFVPGEHLIAWNPDFILIHRLRPDASIEEVLANPTFQTISAVKNKNVYYIMDGTVGYDIGYAITMTVYLAKLFHPDKFETLDVKQKCDEILMDLYGEDNLYRYILERGRGELCTWE